MRRELTNLKKIGKRPKGPIDAGANPNGGGHKNHFVRGTAIGTQCAK